MVTVPSKVNIGTPFAPVRHTLSKGTSPPTTFRSFMFGLLYFSVTVLMPKVWVTVCELLAGGNFTWPAAGCQPTATAAAIIALVNSRSEEHTSELQSLMRISYAVFCLKKKI